MISDYNSLPLVQQVGEPLDENFQHVFETVQFFIVSFTLLFYIFVTYVLWSAQVRRVEELSTPFFKLCISTGIIDILALLNNYLGAMFPKWGWGTRVYLFLDHNYAHVYLCLAWLTGTCQVTSVSVIATNRLSAILSPNSHIWTSLHLRIAIFVQFLPGTIVGIVTLFNETQLYRNSRHGIVPNFENQTLSNFLFLFAIVFLTTTCTYLIFAYCYLLVMLRNKRKAMKSSNLQKSKLLIKKKELKLFVMSCITVTIQIVTLCLFLSYTIGILALSLDKFYLMYNVISDLHACINPYLLWIFSDCLRRHILRRLGIRWAVTRRTTISSILNVHH